MSHRINEVPSALRTASAIIFMITNFVLSFFFFFNDTATTEIYTLSLHDALPILIFGGAGADVIGGGYGLDRIFGEGGNDVLLDRKSTRLNSSHSQISYAVFCLKKKNKTKQPGTDTIIKGLALA